LANREASSCRKRNAAPRPAPRPRGRRPPPGRTPAAQGFTSSPANSQPRGGIALTTDGWLPSATQFRPHLPQLPREERDRRWGALRELMALHGLDCVVVVASDVFMGMGMANFRYLTQIGGHHGGVLVFPLRGSPVVFHGPAHEHVPYDVFLAAHDWIEEIRPNRGVGEVVAAVRDLGCAGGRIGLVSYRSMLSAPSLPQAHHEALRRGLPEAAFEDANPLLDRLRLVKSRAEISLLEQAGRIARSCYERFVAEARPGRRECEVWAEAVAEQVRLGGEPQIFFMLASGPLADEPGRRKYLVHPTAPPVAPTQRVLQRDDLLIAEFHACYGGYLAAVECSAFLGRAPRELRRIHEVSVRCLEAGLPHFRPGVPLAEVWEAMRAPVAAAGLDFLELGFHGHGLASPEFPTAVYKSGAGQLAGDRLADFRLRENMVFGTNIDVQDPAWKPDVGLMFGDTVQVTPEGGRLLVGVPRRLPEL
jgi:Xaa-Pro aminopeptidase